MTEQCDGRYPVPQTSPPREEAEQMTYRCGKVADHSGEHGPLDALAPSNLVSRLRQAGIYLDERKQTATDKLLCEAAAEIERLRAALEKIAAGKARDGGVADPQGFAIEALRGASTPESRDG